MNRRDAIKVSLAGLLGGPRALRILVAAAPTLSLGCDGISWADIVAYSTIGWQAVQSIVKILTDNGIITGDNKQLIDDILNRIQGGFDALSKAVNAYESAPASDKSTVAGQVLTALQSLADYLGQFWNAVKIPDAQLAALISALLTVIVSTIKGFMAFVEASGHAAPPLQAVAPVPQVAVVPPKKRRVSQFKSDFNSILQQRGLSKYAL